MDGVHFQGRSKIEDMFYMKKETITREGNDKYFLYNKEKPYGGVSIGIERKTYVSFFPYWGL